MKNSSINLPSHRSLWLALLGGPVIYSVYFLLGYFWVEVVCKAGSRGFTWLSLNAITSVTLLLTLVALLLTGAMGIWTYSQAQRQRANGEAEQEYVAFMLRIGLGLDLLFALVILVTGAPMLVLQACPWI